MLPIRVIGNYAGISSGISTKNNPNPGSTREGFGLFLFWKANTDKAILVRLIPTLPVLGTSNWIEVEIEAEVLDRANNNRFLQEPLCVGIASQLDLLLSIGYKA